MDKWNTMAKFNFTSQRNANLNYIKTPSHLNQNEVIKKKKQTLARMWVKGNPYTLLVAM